MNINVSFKTLSTMEFIRNLTSTNYIDHDTLSNIEMSCS